MDDGEIGQSGADNDGAPSLRPKGKAKDSFSAYNRGVSSISNLDEVKSKASTIVRHQDRLSALLNSQYRVKKVGASKHILDTYHDSFLYGKVPSSVKVRAALRAGWIGNIWHFVRTFQLNYSAILQELTLLF